MAASRLRALIGCLCLLAWPVAAIAHAEGDAAAPGWNADPWVVGPLAAALLLYAMGAGRLWRRAGFGRGLRAPAVASFAAGWLVLVVALVSPVDALGARYLWAHMLQHELLMVLAAPLLVLGRPLEAWTWALPPAWRGAAGRVARARAIRTGWRAITGALGAGLLHAAAVWIWHLPRLFQAAAYDEALHTLQHVSFLGTALLFWWAVLGELRTRRRYGPSMALLFTTMMHTGALGALMALSPVAWYPFYAEGHRHALGALEDQQLAGLIMWVPGGAAYLLAALAVIAQALARPDATRGAAWER